MNINDDPLTFGPPIPPAPPKGTKEVESPPEPLENSMRGFWPDWRASFRLPLRGQGQLVLSLFAFMNLLSWAAREFNPFSLGALMQIVIASWLLSYDFRIILETDKGEDQLPSLKVYPGIWGGIWRGIVRPALLMCMWILVFFLLPWIIWTIIIKTTGIDVFWREAISPILQGVALFLAPMTLLIMAMKGFSIQLFRWDRQFRSIFRAPRMQYWVILGFGWVSGFDSAYFKDGVEVLLNFVTPANPSDPRYLYFGLLIGLNAVNALVLAYLYLVSTRMTGLFYRYNKQHLLWRGE